MKKSVILFAAIALMMASSTKIMAQWNQGSASEQALATIVIPLTVTNGADMNFGMYNSPSSNASVLASVFQGLNPSGVTYYGGLSWGYVNVNGQANHNYFVTLPGSATLYNPAGNSMVVDAFTSYQGNSGATSGHGTLNGSGYELVYIGGTLHINANQQVGSYAGSYTVYATYE